MTLTPVNFHNRRHRRLQRESWGWAEAGSEREQWERTGAVTTYDVITNPLRDAESNNFGKFHFDWTV